MAPSRSGRQRVPGPNPARQTLSRWAAVAIVFLAFCVMLYALLAARPVGGAIADASSTPDTPSTTDSPSTPTATPTDPKEITICQAQEPNTLFIYGGPSRGARNVLEAIYDGPIDTLSYEFQPSILVKLPSLEDGDAAVREVVVQEGQTVVDARDEVVQLIRGSWIIDADGRGLIYRGGEITLAQMVVTFTLKSGIVWADGHPLTSDDSVFSFELAGEFESPSVRRLWDRTLSYEASDAQTVVWTSVPGYLDAFFFLNFYQPLPRHVWGLADAETLTGAEVARRRPLGWGPFAVDEWQEGEHITLVRNPHYFRADEGLPYLDRVTFRFVGDLERALQLYLAGDCDVIAQDVIEGQDMAPLLQLAESGSIHLVSSRSTEWEHLDFGIQTRTTLRPAALFEDVRVRQAVALCTDRERIAAEAFPQAATSVAHSYVASEHPLYAGGELTRWPFTPTDGRAMLEEVGWRDEDSDGVREAHDVSGVPDGTEFRVKLLTTEGDAAREHTAAVLADNLADCGIGLTVEYLGDEDFYEDGPEGPILGRKFDLALFSWLNDLGALCWLYISDEIPQSANYWDGSNTTGYASDEYDEACLAALDALPGTDAYQEYHRAAQKTFSRELPVLPLYYVPKYVATRPGVSGVVLDPSQYLEMWTIESFDVSPIGSD
jgi:peptide/nickel transport system substrate-binding protein